MTNKENLLEKVIKNTIIPNPKLDTVPGHPAETSAVEMDNYNKRKSLKKNSFLSPAHMRKMRKLPY